MAWKTDHSPHFNGVSGAVEPGFLFIVYDYSCVMIRVVVAELSFENSPGMVLVIRVDEGKTVDSILKVSSYKAVSGIARNFISEMSFNILLEVEKAASDQCICEHLYNCCVL